MSVDVPQPFRAKVEGPIGPITVDGIPNPFHVAVDNLPKLSVGVDPVSVAVTKLPKISVGLDPLTVNPVDVNLSINKIPDVRAHVPADFTIGMKVLGIDVFAVRVSGEAQLITEPYHPNPCEETAAPPPRPALQPLPAADD